ncbi:hypothetical protein FOCC_FOCC006291 [Frankliniella occidentalis]|nr:hypothetical protein FOCC_FOCC006291 [Frankliniella occidentalis]
MKDGFLFKLISVSPNEPLKWTQVLPKEKRHECLQLCHDSPISGHGGFYRTFERLRRTAYWPGMRDEVKDYVARCQDCQQVKKDRRKPPGLMGTGRVVSAPFEAISTDLVGPLPRSRQGYTYLSVITDLFSKYVLIRPLRTATAKNVAKHLKESVFLVHGAPKLMLCDNGCQYDSKIVRDLCKQYGTKIKFNIPYNPRSNPTERYNQTIETMLVTYIQEDHRDWDQYLSEIQCAVNTSVSHATGHTPHLIVFGTEFTADGRDRVFDANDEDPEIANPEPDPEEREARERLVDDVKKKLELAYKRNAQRYNLRRRTPPEFKAGCMVWRRNFVKSDKARGISKKLAKTWLGPFTVKHRIGRVSYMLTDKQGKDDGPWHVDQIKKNLT